MKKLLVLSLFTVSAVVVGVVFLGIPLRDTGAATVGVNGDVNGNGTLDISDAIYLLAHLFRNGPAPVACAESPGLSERVAGLEAAVEALRGETTLTDLSCARDEVPRWNGSQWTCAPILAPESGRCIDLMNAAHLVDATRDAGGTGRSILICRPIDLGAREVTVPETVTLDFLPEGYVILAAGDTLTVNGPIRAARHQIFAGPGVVRGEPKVDAVYPEWFGAIADGTTDSTEAIQKAIDLQGPEVSLGNGTYVVSETIRFWGPGISLRGAGRLSTTIEPAPAFGPEALIQCGSSPGRPLSPRDHHNAYLGHFHLDGNGRARVGIVFGGEVSPYSFLGTVDDLWVENCQTGVELRYAQGAVFRSLNVTRCDTGLLAAGGVSAAGIDYANTASTFVRCRLYDCSGIGAHVQQLRGSSFVSCLFENNRLQGLKIDRLGEDSTARGPIHSLGFYSCWFEKNLLATPDAGTGHRGDIEIQVAADLDGDDQPGDIRFVGCTSEYYLSEAGAATDYGHALYVNPASPLRNLTIDGGTWTSVSGVRQKVRIESKDADNHAQVSGSVRCAIPYAWFSQEDGAAGASGLLVEERAVVDNVGRVRVEPSAHSDHGGESFLTAEFGLAGSLGSVETGTWTDVAHATKNNGAEGVAGYLEVLVSGYNHGNTGSTMGRACYVYSFTGGSSGAVLSLVETEKNMRAAAGTPAIDLRLVPDEANNRIKVQVYGLEAVGASWITGRVFVRHIGGGYNGRSGIRLLSARA